MKQTNKNLSLFLICEIRTVDFEAKVTELPADAGLFFQMAALNKLGINPQSTYDTPLGIYSYPFDSEYKQKLLTHKLPFANDQPYVHFFKAKGGIKPFVIQTYSNYAQDKELLRTWFESQKVFKTSPGELYKNFSKFVTKFREKYFAPNSKGAMIVTTMLQDLAGDTKLAPIIMNPEKSKILNYLVDQLKQLSPARLTTDFLYNEILNDKYRFTLYEPNDSTSVGDMLESVCEIIADFFVDDLKDFDLGSAGKVNFDVFAENAEKEARQQTEAGFLWNLTRLMAVAETEDRTNLARYNAKTVDQRNGRHRSSVVWTYILSKVLGYDYASDNGSGLIHPHEPTQTVFFNPKAIQFLETTFNPKATEVDPTKSTQKDTFGKSLPKPSSDKNESIESYLKIIKPLYKRLTNNAPFTLKGLLGLLPNLKDYYEAQPFFDDVIAFFVLSIIPHEISKVEEKYFTEHFRVYPLENLLSIMAGTFFPGTQIAALLPKFIQQYKQPLMNVIKNRVEFENLKETTTDSEGDEYPLDKQEAFTAEIMKIIPLIKDNDIRSYLISIGEQYKKPPVNIEDVISDSQGIKLHEYLFDKQWELAKTLKVKSPEELKKFFDKISKRAIFEQILQWATQNKKQLSNWNIHQMRMSVDGSVYREYQQMLKTLNSNDIAF